MLWNPAQPTQPAAYHQASRPFKRSIQDLPTAGNNEHTHNISCHEFEPVSKGNESLKPRQQALLAAELHM